MKSCALLLSLLLTLAGRPAWAEGEDAPTPDRRQEIDLRIEALDAERAEISTKGPMTATFLGLGMLVGGGFAFAYGLDRAIYDDTLDDEPPAPGLLVAGILLLGAGTVAALAGGVMWGKRDARRSEIDAERESLIEERDGLAAALSRLELHSAYRDSTHFVTLGLRF